MDGQTIKTRPAGLPARGGLDPDEIAVVRLSRNTKAACRKSA
jgi:hypothetical protein